MKIGDKEYTEITVVDKTGKVIVSVTDDDILEHKDFKVLFGTEENPIEYLEENSCCYAREKGMDYGQSRY